MIRQKSFAGEITPRLIDTEYEECNFSQPQPVDNAGVKTGVRIFPGDDTPRTFIRCNLVNCELPPDSSVIDCLQIIMQRDVAVNSHTIVVDGVQVASLEQKSDFIYGRYLPDGTIEYLGTPRENEGRR